MGAMGRQLILARRFAVRALVTGNQTHFPPFTSCFRVPNSGRSFMWANKRFWLAKLSRPYPTLLATSVRDPGCC